MHVGYERVCAWLATTAPQLKSPAAGGMLSRGNGVAESRGINILERSLWMFGQHARLGWPPCRRSHAQVDILFVTTPQRVLARLLFGCDGLSATHRGASLAGCVDFNAFTAAGRGIGLCPSANRPPDSKRYGALAITQLAQARCRANWRNCHAGSIPRPSFWRYPGHNEVSRRKVTKAVTNRNGSR